MIQGQLALFLVRRLFILHRLTARPSTVALRAFLTLLLRSSIVASTLPLFPVSKEVADGRTDGRTDGAVLAIAVVCRNNIVVNDDSRASETVEISCALQPPTRRALAGPLSLGAVNGLGEYRESTVFYSKNISIWDSVNLT